MTGTEYTGFSYLPTFLTIPQSYLIVPPDFLHSMASQLSQDILDRIRSVTDWILRTFLAVILRCLGVLLKAVFRPEDRAVHVDEHGEPRKKKGEIIQERMSGVRQKKNA